jgi:PAS domain S-box-containing protein
VPSAWAWVLLEKKCAAVSGSFSGVAVSVITMAHTTKLPSHLDYSNNLLKSILNVGNDYICVKDREGRFVYINELDASLYNAKPQDMLGCTVEPWVGKAQFNEWLQDDIQVLDSGSKKHYEASPRTGKDWVTHWFDTVKIPFRDEQSGQDLLLVVHRDVTAIKEAEIERNALREQRLASQKLEAIGLLSASVAHDFNNILTIILASSRHLTDKYALDPKLALLGQSITKSAERAADIVDRLLVLSRRDNLEHGYLDLRVYLLEMQNILHAALGEKIHLTWQISSEALPLRGNGAMIEQALINLIFNARDALPHGGNILLKATIETELNGTPFVTMEVQDNGMGMSLETQKKIFEPFFTTKPVGQGSGLGLVVVQRIMEQHNGRIEMESELGVGTRFILKFPVEQDIPSTELPTAAVENQILEGKTLLLVEDEELLRGLISLTLETLGIHAVLASNGDEAWKIFSESGQIFDAVLCDIVMDGELDGVSLRMKIFEHNPAIPVLLMTGYSFDYFKDHDSMPENTDILHKPFLPEALGAKLPALLAK